jgi:hypothetical protein
VFGDNVHEFLAPCIYEGEGEMLGMAFFKSLVKTHGKEYFEPIGRVLFDAGIKTPNPANPMHAWMLRKPLAAYAKWWVGMRMIGRSKQNLSSLPPALQRYATAACEFLSDQGLEISAAMRTHQLKLADRQCSMIDLSQRLQDAVVILVTSLYGSRHTDPLTQQACEVICSQLWRGLKGERASNRDWRRVTELGGAIADTGWSELNGVEPEEILMKYAQ